MLKPLIRTLAFLSKEINEVRRQPRLMLSLIIGPFLILVLFGVGYGGTRPAIPTALVIQPEERAAIDVELLRQTMEPTLRLVAVDEFEARAIARLVSGEVELVEIIPAGVAEAVLDGRQSGVRFIYSEVNPLDEQWIRYLGYATVAELNRRLVIASLAQVQGELREELERASAPAANLQVARRLAYLPPEVVVSPLRQDYENVHGESLTIMMFYAPAVLALVLQHMAVTFGSLSLVRERLIGALEFFGVAPVSLVQIILGKTLAYMVMIALVGAALTGLLLLLGIPLRGDPWQYAGLLALFTLASLGVGLLISTLSRTETQAVQLSMLTLLLSMFFSGFFLPLDAFVEPIRSISFIVPLTWGIQGLQQVMLLGSVPGTVVLVALTAITVASYTATLLLWRRQLGRG